jgi:hypothetical protein
MVTNSCNCRHCGAVLSVMFADLNATPVSNDYLHESRVLGAEPYYPLRALVCDTCYLVQLQDFVKADDLFREDYAYFSSVSSSWLAHAKAYTDRMIERFALNQDSFVVELASNDGYLLQYFKAQSVRVLGVEPCRSVAEAAINEKGVPTEMVFFGQETAIALRERYGRADLMAANNVLAHVPFINDFVSGVTEILADEGVMTFEFPHLLNLMAFNQFDTIYHEHFSYLSLIAVKSIAEKAGLRVFDVEQLPTHGGSLRVYVCHKAARWEDTDGLRQVEALEAEAGLADIATYTSYAEKVRETKRALLSLLIDLKRAGKTVVGYGAPAKGNTLLNYCGISSDMIDFTVDRAPSKQGMYLPGSRLAIKHPDAIREAKPDYVLILPWNLKEEIINDVAFIREWGGKFIVPIPRATIID